MLNVNITNNIPEVIRTKNEAIARGLEKIGLTAERYAKGYAPVDTGRLRNSISHYRDHDGDAVIIGTNVEYAIYQEFGTHRMKGTPFLRPAVNNHLNEYKNIIKSELKS